MGPVVTELEDIERPDPEAPHIILRTIPALSFSTPTHSIRVQEVLPSLTRDEQSALPDTTIDTQRLQSPGSHGVGRLPRPVVDNRYLSARWSLGNDAELLKARETRRAMRKAVSKLEGKVAKLKRKVQELTQSVGSITGMLQAVLASLTTLALPQDPATPTSPAPEVVRLEEHFKGTKAVIEEIEATLKEIEVDAMAVKLDGMEIIVDIKGVWAGVQELKTNIKVLRIEEMIQLVVAAHARVAVA